MQFLSLSHQSNQQELEPIQYNGKRMVISFPKRKWKVLESHLFGTLKEEPCLCKYYGSIEHQAKKDIFTVPLQHWVRVHRV